MVSSQFWDRQLQFWDRQLQITIGVHTLQLQLRDWLMNSSNNVIDYLICTLVWWICLVSSSFKLVWDITVLIRESILLQKINPGITTHCQVNWLSYYREEVMPELVVKNWFCLKVNTEYPYSESSVETIRSQPQKRNTKDTLDWLPALALWD